MDRADPIIGPALTGYTREADVEKQLERLRSAPRTIVQRAVADRETRLETLVSIARTYHRAERPKDADHVLEEIVRRVSRRIRRHLDVWNVYNAEDRADLIQELLQMLFAGVRSLDRDQEFWECRFWVCFDRRAHSILRSWAHSSRPGASLDQLAEESPGLLRQPERVAAVDRAAAYEALRALPEPLRTTFYLKYLVGYQEESLDENELTIARTLGVTGRTVRNYLERAEALLARWRSAEVH